MNRIIKNRKNIKFVFVGIFLCLGIVIHSNNVNAIASTCDYELMYSCGGGGCPKEVTSGTAALTHTINVSGQMPSGQPSFRIIPCVGSVNITHSGEPTFVANDGYWDTPDMYQCNGSGDCMNFYGGGRSTSHIQDICGGWRSDGRCNRDGKVTWQIDNGDIGIDSVAVISGAQYVSCTKTRCTAIKPGTAVVKITTKSADPRIFASIVQKIDGDYEWLYITKYSSSYVTSSNCSVYDNSGSGDIRLTLPPVTKYFTIVVSPCAPGVCDSTSNGKTFINKPTVNLCVNKGGGTNPVTGPTWVVARDRWEWTCPGAPPHGADSGICWAKKIVEQGECKSTVATEFSYETTDWPPPTITYSNYNDYFCLGGRLTNPQPPETRSGYIIPKFPNVNTTTTWTCSGINSTTNDQCEATRLEPVSNCVNLPGEYNTKPADNLLCQAPNKKVSGIDIRDPWDGKWWWTCSHEWFVGPPAHSDPSPADCSARSCLADKVLNYPAQVYLTKDGQSVNVSVFCDGTDGYKMCCDIGMAPVEDGTPDTHICSGESGEFVVPDGSGTYPAECYFKDGCENDIPNSCPKVDKPITIQTMCMAKSCNAQGTCQATPVAATSLDSADCKSSCNSNADCSSGRMIETKP